MRLGEGVFEALRHFADELVATGIDGDHGIVGEANGPELTIGLFSFLEPFDEVGAGGGVLGVADHYPVAIVVEGDGVDALTLVIISTDFLFQTSGNVAPSDAIVVIEDDPGTILGDLHIIDVVTVGIELLEFGDEGGGATHLVETVGAVNHQVAAGTSDGDIAAFAKFSDGIADIGAAVLGGSRKRTEHGNESQEEDGISEVFHGVGYLIKKKCFQGANIHFFLILTKKSFAEC